MNQKSHIQRYAVQTWEMAGSPARHQEEKKRAGLFPAATHQHITPVTSYTPHFIWNAAGPTSRMALPGQHIPPASLSRACPPPPPPVLSVEIQSLGEHTSSSDNRGGGEWSLKEMPTHLSSSGRSRYGDPCDSSWWPRGRRFRGHRAKWICPWDWGVSLALTPTQPAYPSSMAQQQRKVARQR